MNRIVRAAEALGIPRPRNVRSALAKATALLLALTTLAFPAIANAATLTSASVSLSDSRPSSGSVGTNVSYTFMGSSVTNTGIQCVKAVFSTTSTGDTAPTGWSGASGSVDATNSTLVNGSSSGWALATSDGTSSTGQKNIWQYTHATTSVTPTTLTGATFVFAGVTNSTVAGTTYYLKFNTYNNTDCSTSPVDSATVEFINTTGSTMSLTIDNTLSFSVAGHTATQCMTGVTATVDNSAAPNTIPFGTVTANSIACQVLTAATNATNGYTIYIRDNGQLQNTLGQKIPDVGSTTGSYTNGYTNASPGATFTNNTSSLATYPGFNQGAYGYSTDDASLGTGTAARFTNGGQHWASYGHSTDGTGNAEVAYEPVGVSSTTYNIAHQVGITNLTQPGTYTTTVIYTCTPVY